MQIHSSESCTFRTIVVSYRWIGLGLTSEIPMKLLNVSLWFHYVAKENECKFGFVANSFRWMQWKKVDFFNYGVVCFISGFQCVISRIHVCSAHKYTCSKANELCKYSGMTKLSGKPHLFALYLCLCLPFFHTLSSFLQCWSIVNDDLQSGHTQQPFYINKSFKSIYWHLLS